jgi:hypothetical protein
MDEVTLIAGGETTNAPAETQQIADPATATPEVKDTQAQAPETESKTPSETDKPAGAPEKYEFTETEGRDFDPAVIEAYSDVAKELNLSNVDAQKLLDKVAPVMMARQIEQLEAIKTDWENTSKVDKEFGCEKLSENLGIAKKALDAFGTPELKALLVESGLGNNPEVIRFMFRAGKNISEDNILGGKAPSSGEKSLADRLYA